jgi:hypothetical protein
VRSALRNRRQFGYVCVCVGVGVGVGVGVRVRVRGNPSLSGALKEGGWLCVGCVSLRHLDGWFICDRYGEL